MAKSPKVPSEREPNLSPKRRSKPFKTQEDREKHLASLAMDRAEERLRNGTATSAEILHFLKLGSSQAQEDLKKTKNENKLIEAKVSNIKSQEKREEVYQKAIDAFKKYSGSLGYD